ncbi:MAG TPA: AAA family ATPase [Pseudonocardia sp.]|nr:AAA family ATPase [Pseudonocardia sp.]
MTSAAPPAEPLLERRNELAVIEAAVARVPDGRGGTLVIEGPAGVGKTRLLGVARTLAGDRDMLVLSARASPLEREFAFGVVRGLLEPALRAADPADRARLLAGAAQLAAPVLDPGAEVGTPTFATLHGLYWLLAALAEQQPLVLAVDDAHWADVPSLRALAHLAHRIDELPILLALTARPAEPGAPAEWLDALREEVGTTVLRPEPLTPTATGSLVRAVLGDRVDCAFAAACHEVTGGNPMLLGALVRSLRQAGVLPRADAVPAVHERAPAIVSAFVLPRLRHLSREDSAVARALAVLGPGSALRHLAAVAGLDPAAAARAVDRLGAAELVVAEPAPAFAHPLLGQVIAERIPVGERHAAHRRAAHELAADHAPAEAVAAHLLQVEPLRDAWAVERLRAAARTALAKGAPETAITYLGRALAEPPGDDVRREVLFELGDALCRHGPTEGFARLAEALELTTAPAERDRIALQLARRLLVAWEVPRAFAVLERAVAELDVRGDGDPQAALMIQAELVGLARADPRTRAEARRRLDRLRPRAGPDTAAGCALLANLAVEALQKPGRADEAVALAVRATAGVAELDGGPFEIGVLYLAVGVMLAAGALDEALVAADRTVDRVRRRGARPELGAALAMRADAGARRGALLDADADARLALEMIADVDMPYPRRLLTGYLLPTLVERGLLDEAERDLAGLAVDHHQVHLLAAVGRLRTAQGRPTEAREHLLDCGARLHRRGWNHPGLVPWRTDAALACHLLGETERARELAGEALAQARRYDAAIPLGRALRTTGMVAGELDATREAVAVLASTPARLEHAHALVELGAALRRANHRADAREPLRAGLDLAHRCAATALAERATEELTAAGARPRTPLRTGVEALSPSERRVARLAAEGRSNRDIAQALFVTTKTVELHLSATYRKLGVSARGELRRMFGEPLGSHPDAEACPNRVS